MKKLTLLAILSLLNGCTSLYVAEKDKRFEEIKLFESAEITREMIQKEKGDNGKRVIDVNLDEYRGN